ncbi:MAG: ADP-glyceromanno-heptose 6-epimerase [Magnetovibrio sp.]|nr:ADP-glyceromanno-heptose 6-epimerase [Magnetovibrio sp.]
MYVITGGAGFIGSNIAWGLEQQGLGPITVIDRLGDGDKWRNLAKREIAEMERPRNTLAFLDRHADEIKAVIHMGAISATTETDVDLIVENNFRFSVGVWDWCTENRVPLIYASSAATYGDGANGFDDDASVAGLAKLRPLNPYGWSKHLFDRRVARIAADGGAQPPHWAGLKFFNVYGPNERHKGRMRSVVSQVYPRAVSGDAAVLFKSHHPNYADGGQLRDFIWVDDCVDIVLWLLANPSVSGIFNCGTGKARSFADLASAVFKALGREPQIDYVDTPEDIRDKYQYFTEAGMDRLRAAGYAAPMTELEDGVAKYVRGFLDADDPYR